MTKASLSAIVKALNEAGVRYLVVGGIAVIAHGYTRLTKDVDLMIQLEEGNLVTALRALERLGYRPQLPVTLEEFADPRNREIWIAEKQMKVFKLFSDAHRETGIDVFVYDPIGFDEAYDRASSFTLSDNVNLPVCSYEDLVKLKLLASRPQDLADLDQLRIARGES
jgi:predicted nucleotidyltransferase